MENTAKKGGFENGRYRVMSADGKQWLNKSTPWFSLRLDGKDPHAIVALHTYADSIKRENPELSNDLMGIVRRYRRRVA